MFKALSNSVKTLTDRIRKMICIGEVSELDPKTARVKVKLPEFNHIESDWLPILALRSRSVSTVMHLSKGEQVLCLFPPIGDMSRGVVVGALYNQSDVPFIVDDNKFGVRFNDGTTVTYDEKVGKLRAQIRGGTPLIEMTPEKTKIVSEVEIIGNVSISKNLTVGGNTSVQKNLTVQQNISATGLVSDGVGSMAQIRMVYNGHKHDASGNAVPPM